MSLALASRPGEPCGPGHLGNLPAPRVTRSSAFGRVAVLYGGASAEREVSLESGAGVLAALGRLGVDAHGIDRGEDVIERLASGGFDRAFIILHGRGGEDGTIQGALESLGLPYTGSGVLGSALAMDKHRSKLVWRACGVPTPDFVVLASERELPDAGRALGYPLVVKPVHEGSTIGVSKAHDEESLHRAWFEALRFDDDIIAEPFLGGPEYTAAILGDAELPLIRLETPHELYDYEAKYADGAGTQYLCPCGLDESTENEFKRLARNAFDVLGASGWGRVDFVCDVDGSPRFIDVNTAPGMTGHSLVPMAAQAVGVDYDELVWRVLETSLP